MAKKRIHQIAKELDIASADILFHAKELGIEVKTASSGLTEDEEQLVKLFIKYEDTNIRNKISELNYKNGHKYFGISIHGNKFLQVLKNSLSK